jgi:hypothetical protein
MTEKNGPPYMPASTRKKQWEATILFEGWPIEGEDLTTRVRECIETHPTLGFLTTAVLVGEAKNSHLEQERKDHARTKAGWEALNSKVNLLRAAIKKFLGASGHDLCHENRLELWRALGDPGEPPVPVPVAREDFRKGCIQYEAELYGQLERRIQCMDCGAFGVEPIMHHVDCKPGSLSTGAVAGFSSWRAEDPRMVLDKQGYKRGNIIIVANGRAERATVEMRHGWSVMLDGHVCGKNFIGEADAWPDGWLWTEVPREQKGGTVVVSNFEVEP